MMHFFYSVYYNLIASTRFQHLFAHHQQALHIQKLVYIVRNVSAGCCQGWNSNRTNRAETLSPFIIINSCVYLANFILIFNYLLCYENIN
jgi:hypothetical protein